jgi:GDP-4-dehydro-6-deoxy-D-mannose reductase
MKLIVTGAAGFVGKHFLNEIKFENDCTIIGTYNLKAIENIDRKNISFEQLDLLNFEKVNQFLSAHQPTHILHLAAQSSVGKSWAIPYETLQDNILMTHNILEAIRVLDIKTKIIIAGSAEIYAPKDDLLIEANALQTNNPYALSKFTIEKLCEIYTANYGLNIICTRSFNQIGPGQNPNFVIPAFAQQIIKQQKDRAQIINLSVGNVSVIRDFTDVRDMVQAYWKLLNENCNHYIYNICSGKGTSIKTIIETMEQVIKLPIHLTEDKTKLRPNDNAMIVGDNSLFAKNFDWQPKIELRKTIEDILQSQNI